MNETQTPTALEVIAACIASGDTSRNRVAETGESEQVAAVEGSEGNPPATGRMAAPGQLRGDAGLTEADIMAVFRNQPNKRRRGIQLLARETE